VFLHRAGLVLVGTQVGDLFRPTLFNMVPFLDGILASLLWTCGLIIMVNQRLNAETGEAKDRVERLFRTLSGVVEEQKRTEVALRESEGRLAEAQAMAQLGSWTWDVKTGCVEWTEEVFRIFQLDPREFVPQIDSILALSPWPEDHERDQELIRKAMESREKGSYEQRFLRPDGSSGCYHSTFQGRYDDGGALLCIIGTVQDITERKRAEEVLHQRNAELERFNRATVGRELRMIELKREINALCAAAGQPARYALEFTVPNTQPPFTEA
jgi:PAS domain S-box-containing protein